MQPSFDRRRTAGGTLFAAICAFSLLGLTGASTSIASAQGSDSLPVAQSQAAAPNTIGHTVRSERIAAGTSVRVKVLEEIASDTAQPGDSVRVEVAGDDTSGLPVGTVFVGRVAHARPATPTIGGVLKLQLALPADSYQEQHSTAAEAANGRIVTDASAYLTGQNAQKAGHATGIAAVGGAILGYSRKHKFGDVIEGGALGALGGSAVDQAQKHAASDVKLKKGSEITIKLDRPMSLRTVVVPEEAY